MPVVSPWLGIDQYLTKAGIQIGSPTVGQTNGGTHAAGSLHYVGRARDYGRSNSNVPAIVAALKPYAEGPQYVIEELFSSPEGVFYDKGVAIDPSSSLRAQHNNHVHVALRSGASLDGATAPVGGGAGQPTVDNGITKAVAILTDHETFARLLKFGAGIALLTVGLIYAGVNVPKPSIPTRSESPAPASTGGT